VLKEGYLAKWDSYPKHEVKIAVTRTAKSVLSPSWKLLNDYKTGKIDWEEYARRFIREMDKPEAQAKLQRIRELAKTKDVRLICYEKNPPCHRFILLELIKGER
jgi:uncharacterized protein YeaO (DUF488 family)